MRKVVGGAAVGGLFAVLVTSACGSKKPTAIVAALTTEGRVPAEVDRLQITVTRAGDQKFKQVYSLPAQDAPIPGTITIENTQGESASEPVIVNVQALKHDNTSWTIAREARLPFSTEHTKLLRLPLRYSCLEFDCPSGQSCIGGTCVATDVDTASLPEFDGRPVFVPKGSGSCFDPAACLASSTPAPVTGTADACGFDLPPNVSDFNLGMTWWKAPDNVVVVENDANEGYRRTGTHVTLAPGLCRALLTVDAKIGVPRASSITLSTTCPAKDPNQPVCADATAVPPMDAGTDGGGTPDAGPHDAGMDAMTMTMADGGKDGAIDATNDAGDDAGPDATMDSGGALTINGPNGALANFPAGAYSGPAPSIMVVDTANLPSLPPGLEAKGMAYAFLPHGASFTMPVPIRVPYTSLVSDTSMLVLLTTAPGQTNWQPVSAVAGTDTTGDTYLSASVTHFSFFLVAGPLDDGGMDGPADANDDAPICPAEKCSTSTDTDGGTFFNGCSATCNGATYQCYCTSSDPTTCFCANGKSAPSCSTGSLADCGYPPTCSADVTSDPHNCGYCGHDCGSRMCGFAGVGLCAPDLYSTGPIPAPIPNDWVSDGTNLYYTDTTQNSVFSQPLAGLAPNASPTVLAAEQMSPQAIALDPSKAKLYWHNRIDGSVYSVSVSGGQPTKVSQGQTSFSFDGAGYHRLAVDDATVYWTVQPASGNGLVYAAPVTGGSPGSPGSPLILANDFHVTGPVAYDSTNVYYLAWADSDPPSMLRSVAKSAPGDGGTSQLLATFDATYSCRDILALKDAIYVECSARIYRVPYGGGPPQMVFDGLIYDMPVSVNELAWDGTNLWWTDYAGGQIWATTLPNGPARIFTLGQNEPSLMLVDDGYAFWSAANGTYRLPTTLFP